MSHRKLRAAVAALGTVVALAACGGPSAPEAPALGQVAASQPAQSPNAGADAAAAADAAVTPADPADPAYPADPADPAAGDATTGNDPAAAADTPQAPPTGRIATTLKAVRHPRLGNVVVDQKGMLLYRFDKDTAKPPTSNCTGACATAWPPVLVDSPLTLTGVDATAVGQITRDDGSVQVTLGGWPLYYFATDAKPGDWKGQGSKGVWFAVTKTGAKNTACSAMAAPAASAPTTTGQTATGQTPAGQAAGRTEAGRVATSLRATRLAGLGEAVVDQKGMLIYRFDKDTAKPPTSNCAGACASAWPPVLVDGPLQLTGIDATRVGTVTRGDGRLQVTLGGWPLYYFAKDAKAGDWKGQGSGGVWFAVTRTGTKNVTPPAASSPAAASGGYSSSSY